MEGLFATLTNVDFDDEGPPRLTRAAHSGRARIVEAAGVDEAPDMLLGEIWSAAEDERSLRSLVLFGLRGPAAYAYHAAALGYRDEMVSSFIHEGLESLAVAPAGDLLPMALRVGEANLRCMELLDQANTETFGTPEPTQVARTVEAGSFIVVTGHDLLDLKVLLDQTAGRGVNVYTHGEMLPAHACPLFKTYPHLKGNIGTAWQNQRVEFDNLPGAVLFTTNCIMPPAASYRDRVFTTGPVAYPGCVHIAHAKGGRTDFEPVIERALELGGCDDAKPGRSYFRDFVQTTPRDSVILALARGKRRFNDLDLGEFGGIPRLLDMGQCNDAYGAVQMALALASAFECGVNDLPLMLVLSWYEQKAVAILLTLLHLGVKGIYLGLSLPAFVSSGVLDVLVKEFDVRPTGSPADDLKAILGK